MVCRDSESEADCDSPKDSEGERGSEDDSNPEDKSNQKSGHSSENEDDVTSGEESSSETCSSLMSDVRSGDLAKIVSLKQHRSLTSQERMHVLEHSFMGTSFYTVLLMDANDVFNQNG